MSGEPVDLPGGGGVAAAGGRGEGSERPDGYEVGKSCAHFLDVLGERGQPVPFAMKDAQLPDAVGGGDLDVELTAERGCRLGCLIGVVDTAFDGGKLSAHEGRVPAP